MPVYIQLTDEPIIPGRSGANASGPFTIPSKQKAYLHQGGPFPVHMEVVVPDDKGPYKPGFYLMESDAFQPGQYGPKLNDRGLRLVPLDEGIKALQAVVAQAGKQ